MNTTFDASRQTALTVSNEYMKVTLAKLKADQEKSGKKVEHKVGLGSKSFFSLSITFPVNHLLAISVQADETGEL